MINIWPLDRNVEILSYFLKASPHSKVDGDRMKLVHNICHKVGGAPLSSDRHLFAQNQDHREVSEGGELGCEEKIHYFCIIVCL